VVDKIWNSDARDMSGIESNSVALVVTSPPYFAGKEYEESLGKNGVPGTYLEYLTLLEDVFRESKRVLEPGGRIAVNVANLGRRPYRSLAGDVAEIFQGLGLLLRGEIVWWKGRASGGSCAWGTFQRPGNPVLRDVTERIIIAGKGRFDRALTPKEREQMGWPSVATISRDEFLEATTDLWEIPPESATRVGHPAPFPVDLPKRLIELYTYKDDVVLDPFMGSGSTAIAAIQTSRSFLGFETDRAYLEKSERRITDERKRLKEAESAAGSRPAVRLPATKSTDEETDDLQLRALSAGKQAKDLAMVILNECGFTSIRSDVKFPKLGIELSFIGTDKTGTEWAFDLSGDFSTGPSGLKRSDVLWKVLGKAAVLRQSKACLALVLLTTNRPAPGSPNAAALALLIGPDKPVFDVIELLNHPDQGRLKSYAADGLLSGG